VLAGVSVICWLMGSAGGTPDSIRALHGPRLQSLLAKLVDTPVRGLVYEAGGTAGPEALVEGGIAVRAAAVTYRMPARVVEEMPETRPQWLAAMCRAVDEVLTA
jgi:hypothetical protein